MLLDRDKEVLIFLEKYNAITISLAQYMLFNGSYESARRRLKQLEDRSLIKSYLSKAKKEKIYYLNRKVSDHNVYILDYLKELKRLKCNLLEVKFQPQYLKGNIIPDAYVRFKYDGDIYITLLEVDYTHYTDNIKLSTMYEKLYNERELYEEFKGTFPIVIIARPTPGIRYNSNNFEVIYTDLQYSNLERLLLY